MDSKATRDHEKTGPDAYGIEVSGADGYSYDGTGPDRNRLEVSGTEVCIHKVSGSDT